MKKKVVVYNSTFLKSTETFIYKQTQGLTSDFFVTFLSQKIMNTELFSLQDIECRSRETSERYVTLLSPFHFTKNCQKQITAFLQEIAPDIVHIHFGVNAVRIIPILNKLNLPFLVTFHGTDASKKLKDFRYRYLLKKYIRKNNFICVSKALSKNIESIGIESGHHNIHYIGVDSEAFSYTARTPVQHKLDNNQVITFIQVARFTEKKGHIYTLKTFQQFLQKTDKPELMRLTLIGDGSLLGEMKKLAQSLNIERHIDFTGSLEQNAVIKKLHTADVFLQHSITSKKGDKEGLPIGIMEAMSTGLPVIATNHSGIPEIIQSGVNGFLVNEKDTGHYLKTLLDVIQINDSSIAEQARQTIVRDFNLTNQNKKLAEILTNIVNNEWAV